MTNKFNILTIIKCKDKCKKTNYSNGNINNSIDRKGYYPKMTFSIGMNLGEL